MPRPHHLHRVRVGYIDTDAAKVVHHATYLRYFEQARIEYLRALGWDYAKWVDATGLGLPVVENTVRYRAPAYFDDLLEIDTWVASGKRSSMVWQYRLHRGDKLLTEGSTRCPCTTLEGQLRRIPVELLQVCLGDEFDASLV